MIITLNSEGSRTLAGFLMRNWIWTSDLLPMSLILLRIPLEGISILVDGCFAFDFSIGHSRTIDQFKSDSPMGLSLLGQLGMNLLDSKETARNPTVISEISRLFE